MFRNCLALAAIMAVGLSAAACTTTQEHKVATALTDLQIAAAAYQDACAVSASTSGLCKPSVAKTVVTAGAVAGAAKVALP